MHMHSLLRKTDNQGFHEQDEKKNNNMVLQGWNLFEVIFRTFIYFLEIHFSGSTYRLSPQKGNYWP